MYVFEVKVSTYFEALLDVRAEGILLFSRQRVSRLSIGKPSFDLRESTLPLFVELCPKSIVFRLRRIKYYHVCIPTGIQELELLVCCPFFRFL